MRRVDPPLVLSCEHGGNNIPARYRRNFAGAARALASHHGWDPGALELARVISRVTGAPLVATTTSRLLVECNRSLDHPRLFSEYTRTLAAPEKERILGRYYYPHREAVERAIHTALQTSPRIVHIGVHTFTPVWAGAVRKVDVGLLYDPRRAFEADVSSAVIAHLRAAFPALRIYRNRPYRGWTDGLTTTLRGLVPARRYAGIELEINQTFATGRKPRWQALQRAIALAIRDAVRDLR